SARANDRKDLFHSRIRQFSWRPLARGPVIERSDGVVGLDIISFRDWSAHVGLNDIVDIAVVAILCYVALSWLRRHSTTHSLLVVAVLGLLLWSAARLFDLYLTSLLIQAGAVAF